MGCAEVISLSEVRASKQWDLLREQLHCRFDECGNSTTAMERTADVRLPVPALPRGGR